MGQGVLAAPLAEYRSPLGSTFPTGSPPQYWYALSSPSALAGSLVRNCTSPGRSGPGREVVQPALRHRSSSPRSGAAAWRSRSPRSARGPAGCGVTVAEHGCPTRRSGTREGRAALSSSSTTSPRSVVTIANGTRGGRARSVEAGVRPPDPVVEVVDRPARGGAPRSSLRARAGSAPHTSSRSWWSVQPVPPPSACAARWRRRCRSACTPADVS